MAPVLNAHSVFVLYLFIKLKHSVVLSVMVHATKVTRNIVIFQVYLVLTAFVY